MKKAHQLPIHPKNCILKISLNSDLNQPSGKGVRISIFESDKRITVDLTYDDFMEAMSGNFSVRGVFESKLLDRKPIANE